MEVRPDDDHMIDGIIIISLVVYTVFIAIPFVPSVEVGWGLMLLLGADLELNSPLEQLSAAAVR